MGALDFVGSFVILVCPVGLKVGIGVTGAEGG